jgi:hypothetical protein
MMMDARVKVLAVVLAVAVLLTLFFLLRQAFLDEALCDDIGLDRPEYLSCSSDSDCSIAYCSCVNAKGVERNRFLYKSCGLRVECMPLASCGCVNGECTGELEPMGDEAEIRWAYLKYLEAEEKCDIELVNELITNKSREIVRWTCSNMKNEMKCYKGRGYEIRYAGESGVVYLTPYSRSIENPFFLTKEDGAWKIDLYRMSNGLAMAGSTCDSGWGWRDDALRNEFCSFFSEDQCPDPGYARTPPTTMVPPAPSIDDPRYCAQDGDCEVKLIHCDCSYHCYNRNVKFDDCSRDCTGEIAMTVAPDCLCVDNQCEEEYECPILKAEVRRLMEDVKYCTSDDDCLVDYSIDPGCPFGCDFIRSRQFDDGQELALIEEKIDEYQSKCPICEYECLTPPEDEELICYVNKCTDKRYLSIDVDRITS